MSFKILLYLLWGSTFLNAQEADSLLQLYKSFPDDTGKINKLYKKGFELRNSDIATAINFSEACYRSAAAINNKYYLAKALNLRGILKYQTGLYVDAIADHKKALEFRIQIADTFEQARSLLNLGVIYSDINRPYQAFTCFESALNKFKNFDRFEQVEITLNNIAELQRKMNLFAPAKGNFQTLLAWANGKNDYEKQAVYYNNLGLCVLNLGDTAGAEAYQLQGLQLREMAEDETDQVDSYINLGDIYSAKKDFKQADSCYKKAFSIAQKNKYTTGLTALWKSLSAYYNATGNLKEAYFYLAKHDSILEQNNTINANTYEDVWEGDALDEAKNQTPFFSIRNLFQFILIGSLIIILTIVLIRMGNEQKGQEK